MGRIKNAEPEKLTPELVFAVLDGKRSPPDDLPFELFVAYAAKLAAARNQLALSRKNEERDGLTKAQVKELVARMLDAVRQRFCHDNDTAYLAYIDWLRVVVEQDYPQVA